MMNKMGSVAACLALSAVALAAEEFSYPYFDERLPLELDATRIVLVQEAPGARAVLAASADAAGMDGRSLEAHPQPGTFIAGAPEFGPGADDAAAVRQLVGAMAQGGAADFVSPMFFDHRGEPMWITAGLSVRFAPGVGPAEAAEVVAGVIGSAMIEENWSRIDRLHRFSVDTRNGFEVLEASLALSDHPLVEFAEPDSVMTLRKGLIPNDTFFDELWGIRNTGQSGGTPDVDMDGDLAWDITTGSPDSIVLILDDGVQQDHPDINQIPGQDFTGNGTGGGPDGDCDNHGTSVAGCVSAVINNGLGVVGIAPDCRIASAKFSLSNPPCMGSGTFSPASLVNAIEWGLNQGARVSNNSNSLGQSATVTTKYQTSEAEGMVHFASTGNDAQGSIVYPSALSTVNAVGAVNRFGGKALFSNFGAGIGFTAPGQDILTTDRTGAPGYSPSNNATVDGTSYASPYAAGVAALVLSVNPFLSPDEVEDLLADTAKDFGAPGYDTLYGFGVPDADDAINLAISQIPLPGSFQILSPTDGSTQPIDLTVAWFNADDVEVYNVIIDDDPALGSPEIDALEPPAAGPGTSYAVDPPLDPGTTYYLRVTAVNIAGETVATPDLVAFTTEGDAPPACEGDLDGDDAVGSSDLNIVLATFGSDAPEGDVDGDGMVDSTDLNLVLASFGTVCN